MKRNFCEEVDDKMTTGNETAIVDSQLRDYELVLIINPEASEEAVNARIEHVSKLATGGGGAVSSINQWGKKKLAYPLKHFLEGNYVFAQFKMKPATSKELEANLKISEEVIRHLLIKVE